MFIMTAIRIYDLVQKKNIYQCLFETLLLYKLHVY